MNAHIPAGSFNAWDDFEVSAVSCCWLTVRCLHYALTAISAQRHLTDAEKLQLACYADVDDTLFDLMANTRRGVVRGGEGILHKLEALFRRADQLTRAGIPARELLRIRR